MVWAFAVVAVATLYLALRYKRFQSWVEPVLTITVAIGLAAAAVIWLADSRTVVPEPVAPRNVIAPEEIVLSQMQFTVGQPVTSYRVTGTITGWFLVGSGAGSMLLPWLIGQIFVRTGPQAMTTVLLIALIGFTLFLLLFTNLKFTPLPEPTPSTD